MRDEEIQSLIATSVEPGELHDFDPAKIARIAARRGRQRRIVTTALGLVVIGAAASIAYPGQHRDPSATAQQPLPSTKSSAVMRPGCPGVEANLTTTAIGSRNGIPTIATTRVAAATVIDVEITSTLPSSRVVRGSVVVAKPGSAYGAGEPTRMPANSAVRPENQVAKSNPVLDVVPQGQRLTVTFVPTEPGTYPVFFIAQTVESVDCAAGPPPAGAAATGGTTQRLGEVVVE